MDERTKEVVAFIADSIYQQWGFKAYVIGGACLSHLTRDIDMVVMGACKLSTDVTVGLMNRLQDKLNCCIDVMDKSDPADPGNQKDAKIIIQFSGIKDVPYVIQVSFPIDDSGGDIVQYMADAYPLSIQEAYIDPSESWTPRHNNSDRYILVKTWLNYQHALSKYKKYYPEIPFIYGFKVNQLNKEETNVESESPF